MNASIPQQAVDFNPSLLDSITGFLSHAEAELLYRLASEVQRGGVIVEIGSYQGKSTIALGLGARVSDADIWAVDSHRPIENSSTPFGLSDQAALFRNLLAFGLGDKVRVVTLTSTQLIECWYLTIDMLWIDGDHSYNSAYKDLCRYSQWAGGNSKIVLHDYINPDFPGVAQAVNEFLAHYQNWRIAEQIDTIVVLERVNNGRGTEI